MKAGDSSDPLFTMYSQYAEDDDKNMTKRWTKDADGIIIFVTSGQGGPGPRSRDRGLDS